MGDAVVVVSCDHEVGSVDQIRVRVRHGRRHSSPGQHRQVVRHVADRDDIVAASPEHGYDLTEARALRHSGRSHFDLTVSLGERDVGGGTDESAISRRRVDGDV